MSDFISVFIQDSVKQCPAGNINTGLHFTPPIIFLNLFRAATGQTP
jgi:hypothetical protein